MGKYLIVSSHHESFDTEEQALDHLRTQQGQHLSHGCLQHGIGAGETLKTLIIEAKVLQVVQPALSVQSGAVDAFRNTPATREAYQRQMDEQQNAKAVAYRNETGMIGYPQAPTIYAGGLVDAARHMTAPMPMIATTRSLEPAE